jgi:hypothetical protein
MTDYDQVLMGMVPVGADGSTQRVGFVRAATARFREPFFDQALDKLTLAGPVQTVGLTFAELRDLVGTGVPSPRAVVIHTGRCGSTLLTRMLGHDRGTFPVSEPRAIGVIHRHALSVPGSASADYQALADMLVVLDRFAATRRQRPVLKLSSWQAAGVAGLKDMLGDVPLVMMHRPVAEVVASEMHSPTGWFDWLSGDRSWMKGWAPSVAKLPESASKEEVYAGMWASEVEAALTLPPERTLFVAYADIVARPAEVLEAVTDHIGLDESWNRTGALSERKYYAKSPNPVDAFDPTGRHARPALPEDVLEQVMQVVGDVADRLHERCRTQSQTMGEMVP